MLAGCARRFPPHVEDIWRPITRLISSFDTSDMARKTTGVDCNALRHLGQQGNDLAGIHAARKLFRVGSDQELVFRSRDFCLK